MRYDNDRYRQLEKDIADIYWSANRKRSLKEKTQDALMYCAIGLFSITTVLFLLDYFLYK